MNCLPRFHSVCFSLLILFVVSFSASDAAAQQATAQLTGVITDSTGAIIVGADVTLQNAQTGVSRKATTNDAGVYLFTLLPIGNYDLTVKQSSFQTYEQKGITLVINQNAKIDVSLHAGAPSQVVEVNANATQVDTVSATLGKVETTQRIQALPLAARDTMQLGLLQAGVFAPDQDDGSNNPFSVSGQRSESMTFLLDGADNNDFLSNNMIVNPNPDAVAEFKILTNNYEAEYGRTSGGIVNQVVKPGTNVIHGSAFDFFRNTALDSKDYFSQIAPVFRYNIFGGTVGFPIKKDKMFFFASYQGARRREGQNPGTLTVLTPAERTGDFSDLYTGQIDPNTGFDFGQLTDPTTGSPFMCGGSPCNQVPVDSVMQNYINKYLPLPNNGANGFVEDPVASLRQDQFIFRYDYNISNKDTLSAFYIFDDQPQVFPFEVINGASTGGDVPLGSGFSNAQRFQTGSVSWTRVISPAMVNEFRIGANRSAVLQSDPTDRTTPAALGFLTVFPDDPNGVAPPLVTVGGAFNLGPSPQGPTKLHDATFQYQDTISWTHGKHALKFGADLRQIRNNFNFDFFTNGSFDFGTFYTNTGNALADFVGGYTDNYFQFANAVYGIRSHQLDFFGQDAWKITKNLSLDYGLRYEYNSPQIDPHNEIIGWFPGAQSTKFTGSPPSFLYAGDPGTPNRGLTYPDRNNFAPRLGFAWDMLGNAKLVMRGGFGIFYDMEDGALNLQFGGQAPFGYVASNFPCFITAAQQTNPPSPCLVPVNNSYSADPFQTANTGYSDPFPFIAGGHFGQFFTPAIPFAFVVSPHFRTPYAENFNYGFQYQVTQDTLIEATYVGSLSRKAIGNNNLNNPVLGGPNGLMTQYQFYAGQGEDPVNFISTDCARPLAACNGPAGQAFLGIPTAATQIETNLSDGSSSSNELQIEVDRQMNHGLGFRIAYTLSKTIDQSSGFRARSSTYTDPLDPALDRGLADFDTPQRLVISPIWQIPFGRNSNSLTSKILGGWTLSTIATFQAGNPYTLFSSNNSSLLNLGLDRPDVIGPIKVTHNVRDLQTFGPSDGIHGSCLPQTVTGHFLIDPTNIVCALGPPAGQPVPAGSTSMTAGGVPLFTFGNMRRNFLRGPGINNWDLSLLKDFKLTESKSLEFQANFFNAFNHLQPFSPTSQDGTIGGSSLFGQVTSDTTGATSAYYRGPRIMQFALKVYF
ncbi:MAG TPA: carboxypeptidase regulatory-like domain-containing protein [Terriglobales bacterium]|nr:carboxypeptidase regulatory-like domain-containing protein [Terriglobales bacterium]